MIGQTISHYKITAKLGEGGMGEVYLATDTSLDRQVALKFLPDALKKDPEARERLIREAKAASRLRHNNILTIYSVEHHEGRDFIVMEYVEGKPLTESSRDAHRSIPQVLDLAIAVAEGLQKAHAAGVIHRDLKPANILIDSDGVPRLVDFGLAKVRGTDKLTKTGSTLGTVAYMSPEQAIGQDIDARSDIFSFGAVLYELTTGRTPFQGAHEAAITYAIVNEAAEPMSRFKSGVPVELERIVAKSLAKSPDERYQSMADMAADLRAMSRTLTSAQGRSSAQSARTTPSIAVLPFSNLSADREQDYFCDGIAEEIINALTHVEGLRVMARASAAVFKDKKDDIRAIGRSLNVNTVLDGSVRKSGNRLRITVHLINVADGYDLWSERYDRETEDIFAIQDEITLAVIDKLKVTLLAAERAKIIKRYTENLDAYHLYLRGRYFWNRRYEAGLQKGIECFQQAIACDPLYAIAYSGVADSYGVLGYFGFLSPLAAYPKAKAAAESALRIDESLAEAHASLGWVRAFFDWDWSGAEAAFLRALELNPRYATAHEWYALLLSLTGRFDEGITEARRAQELDPLSLIINGVAGLTLYMARRYDEAIEQLRKTLEMDTTFALTYWFLGLSYSAKRMWNDGESTYEKQLALSPDSPIAMGALGSAYALLGERDKAVAMLNLLQELARGRYVSPLQQASIFMGLGQNDQAVACLEQAYQVRDSFLTFLNVEPWWDPLRTHPGFLALMRSVGLAG
jgi:serine/threonine-protein kinase